jgi:hypothetical protein
VSYALFEFSEIVSLLVSGLAVVFAEDVPSIANSTHPGKILLSASYMADCNSWKLAAWDQLCPIYAEQPPEVLT